jgi:glycosyltransferase involved in cell wall biosynthesis
MRIYFDSEVFCAQPYGGVSRYFVELAFALRSLGEDARILAGVHVNNYIYNNHKTLGVRFPNIRGIAKLARPVNDALLACYSRWIHPDILHKTYYGDHLWQPKSKVVITIYDLIAERWSGLDNSASKAKAQWIKRADAIIAISEYTRKELLEIYNVPKSKITVIHLASGDLGDQSAVVAPPKDSYLLYVGGRGGYKNFSRFVRAYASSKLLNREFRVVCFGKQFSDQERRLFAALGILERMVQVQGDDSVLSAFYRNARALVVPSMAEGFGLPVLEAMQCDCPVICSGTTSLPEVGADAAVYFDPKDEDNIRVTLESTVFDDAKLQLLVGLGRQRSKKFSWARCALETRRLYTEVCCGSSHHPACSD